MSENTSNQNELNPEEQELTDNTSEDTTAAPATEVDPLEEARIEIAELKDKYIRLYSDFENFRRRTAKEKLDLISTANADLLSSLLPIADDFERAMSAFATTSEIDPIKEGIDLIYSKFFKSLEGKGLKPMNAKGEAFNPDIHESVAQFPASDEEMKGKVIEEVEKGYYLNEKVIRYAKVVVGV